MPQGFIKSWRRDRGFGFIKVEGRDSDVFVHISELRDLGRPPKVGDEINFDIETQENGKVRAINCNVKGQADQSQPSNSNNNKTIIAIVLLLALAIGLYFLIK